MPKLHVSFDDVWRCLHDISTHGYATPFENAFLAELRRLHGKYGASFTLYCFERFTGEPDYDIAHLPARYAADFAACASWLRFGFHGEDDTSNYGAGREGASTGGMPTGDCPEAVAAAYRRVEAAVTRAGGAIDPVVRLGFFGGTAENIRALRQCGVTGLLAADDQRISYHLSPAENERLLREGSITVAGLPIFRSGTRLEKASDVQACLDALKGPVRVIFTHEQHCTPEVWARLETCLAQLCP